MSAGHCCDAVGPPEVFQCLELKGHADGHGFKPDHRWTCRACVEVQRQLPPGTATTWDGSVQEQLSDGGYHSIAHGFRVGSNERRLCADPPREIARLAATPEPPPVANARAAVWDLVMADMRQRDAFGRAKYGTPLQAFNGRDPLVDAYQERLDEIVYLRQYIEETRALCEVMAKWRALSAAERLVVTRLIAVEISGWLKALRNGDVDPTEPHFIARDLLLLAGGDPLP